MSYKNAAKYLKSIEPELRRCVESGQYTPQYLEGYRGAVSCLEFASREYENGKAEVLRGPKSAKVKSAQPEEIVLLGSEELVEVLIQVTRMLALLEGVSI